MGLQGESCSDNSLSFNYAKASCCFGQMSPATHVNCRVHVVETVNGNVVHRICASQLQGVLALPSMPVALPTSCIMGCTAGSSLTVAPARALRHMSRLQGSPTAEVAAERSIMVGHRPQQRVPFSGCIAYCKLHIHLRKEQFAVQPQRITRSLSVDRSFVGAVSGLSLTVTQRRHKLQQLI